MLRVKQLKLVKLKWGWSREETGEHEDIKEDEKL